MRFPSKHYKSQAKKMETDMIMIDIAFSSMQYASIIQVFLILNFKFNYLILTKII